jgi:acetylornithine/N-succinyldiaminopimelate aminotransferase
MGISPVYPTYNRFDIAPVRGEGAWVETEDGRRFLDFGAGIAVNCLGHAHPALVKALTEQAGKLWHTSNLYRSPGQEKLAGKLIANSFADTVFFTNSGAEAVECAIKTARRYHFVGGAPERGRLITFEGAFHGRTLATIAAGGKTKYMEGFAPAADGFDQVAFGDLPAAEAAIGPQTAGFLIEPVQGEGGIRVAEPAFLRGLRALCDKHGLLLILDEVQCGIGRTGTLFAYEHAGIEPDIMAIAKAIGGGFPLGACLATEAAARGMTPGTHGSTYGGNPLAMAVGNAVLDEVLAPQFLPHVRELGKHLRQKLARMVDEHPRIFAGLRGEGLMLGLECSIFNTDLAKAMMDEGLLAIAAGDNVVRLLPPLNITDKDIDDAIERIGLACHQLEGSL